VAAHSETPRKRAGLRLWLLAVSLPLTLAACERAIQVRGNLPDDGDVAKISPGIHTRGDIASLLGTPSTVSTFEDSKWYYIGQKTTEFAFFEPEVLERKVVVVSFDDAGTVADTTVYTLEDGQEIEPVGRVTPTEGKDLTILQQLIGNLGRFRGTESK
jgi:outer membrane protein assembly factor BamE (lipoprotein component of BamABCDE complex)